MHLNPAAKFRFGTPVQAFVVLKQHIALLLSREPVKLSWDVLEFPLERSFPA